MSHPKYSLALVTGASQGIGRAVALRLAGEGDLESLCTGSVLAVPRLKLLLENLLLERESRLRWGRHWVPDMNVCTITS